MATNKTTHTRMDTIRVTPDSIKAWKNPPFQRPLRVNMQVMALAEEIKATGVIPGVVTLGILDRVTYLLDGQHRREAFLISEVPAVYADVRYHTFETMADMGEQYIILNGQLVRLRPDDILRAMEGTSEPLQLIRRRCPFVGYDMIRRSERAPILGMSVMLRCWFGSVSETPMSSPASATTIGRMLTMEDVGNCINFLLLAETAWGRDAEYQRLWSALNLTLSMWLYRRLVLSDMPGRVTKLTKEQFRACLMSLSAEPMYLQWLLGRKLSEGDRSPGYGRIKAIFVRRLMTELGKKAYLPQPPWVTG